MQSARPSSLPASALTQAPCSPRPLSAVSRAALIAMLLFVALGSSKTAAQNVQFNGKAADLGLRGDARVNPSTHALEIEIPLGGYPGRAGNSLPVTLSYSSKLWRMGYSFYYPPQAGTPYTGLTAYYAEHSSAGWTSSLGMPVLDSQNTNERYSSTGDPASTPGCQAGYCFMIDRVVVHMPDGSAHELRSTDEPLNCNPGPCTPPDDMYAVDGSRLRYQNSTRTLFMPDGARYLLGSSQFVDRNGNVMTFANGQWTDTLGRTIPTPPLGVTAGDYDYALPGVGNTSMHYTLRWRNLSDAGVMTTPAPLNYVSDRGSPGATSAHSPTLFTSSPGDSTYIANADELFNPVVLYQIVLPTGQAYTFTYNVYGEIDKVVLPTGGYESYTHSTKGTLSYMAPVYAQGNRGVITRSVSAKGDGTDAAVWSYTQSSSSCPGTVCVTAPDGTLTAGYLYGDSNGTFGYSYDGARAGMPFEERVYSASGQMLRRKLTEWTETGTNAFNQYAQQATRNARVTKEVEILLDTGGGPALAKTTTYGYDTTYQFDVGVDRTSVTEYDYASVDQNTAQTAAISSIPTGSLLRTTLTSYLTSNASYRSRNILGLPTSVTIQNASGTTVAQTAMSYDESAYQLGNTYGAVTQWSDPGTVRGNLTTTSHWLDTSNTWLPTHAQYDQAGSVVSAWDANNNQTQVAYSSTYAYAYPTGTTSAVPDTTNTYGSNTPLTTSTAYDFYTGRVTSSTDANGKTSTFDYTDPLNRIKQVNLPDGGQTTYNYVDQHQCGAYVETLTLLDSSGRQFHTWQFSDGLGRPYLAESTDGQDSNNPYLRVDTQYDAMGRAYKVSNPYHTPGCTTANPSPQWTTTGYDALGRVTSVTTTDGAVVSTSYSGATVTVTDQAGKKRSSVSDALGRLKQVTEDPTTGGYNYQTTYTYDVLGNLRNISQGGQARYFMYDSLSRLIRAKNSEQAAGSVASNMTDPVTGNTQWSLAYGYDNNGNLTARVDARNITTNYTYDHLNRNTTVSYTNDPANTPPVTRAYDGLSGGTQVVPNGLGRPWYSVTTGSTGTLVTEESYDAVGRVTGQHQLFAVASDPGGGTYWMGQWWGATYRVTRTYDKAGHVLTETYPSGHSVTYNYDAAGRLADNGSQLAFTGNIGDGVARTYATQVSYSPFGGIQQEQFGTQTALYRKLHYNVRGQLYDQRLGKLPWATDQWDWSGGGAFINFYASADLSAPTNEARVNSGPDNNGNLRQEDTFVQTDPNGTYNASTAGAYFLTIQGYGYDNLNRLTSVSETNYNTAVAAWGTPLSQGYHYDQWGNRTIDTNQTSGAPNTQFTVDAATNRLGVPAGQSGAMGYDAAGNLTLDSYTGNGSRTYDANNRMVTAADSYGGTSTYTYDADGRRVRRANMYGETWQVYGIGGELLAEYASTAATYLPQKEYGYRNGELLVTMSSGNSQRLQQFVTNLYYGALQRDPTSTELQSGVNQLAAAGAQSESQLQTSAAQLARSLFTSTNYEWGTRTDSQYVSDLYNAYLQRGPDSSGLGFWAGQAAGGVTNRTNVCNAFEASSEFQALVASLYGTATSDNQRTETFVNNFFLGAYGRSATSQELQSNRDSLNAAAAVGQSSVQSAAQTMGQNIFAPQLTDTTISDQQFVTNLYEGFLQRGPDSGGLSYWMGQAAGGSANRQNVLNAFKGCTAFQQLSGTLYRETFWLVPDHLGTPRMVADKSGSLSGIKRHDYLPFGEELYAGTGGRTTAQGYSAVDDVRQKFTKYERDSETGLDYAMARYYANAAGRFTSPDPLLSSGKPANPQSWDRYSYAVNNPLKFVDPSGLDWGYYDEPLGSHSYVRHYHYFDGKVGEWGNHTYKAVDFGKQGFDLFTDNSTGDLIKISNNAQEPFKVISFAQIAQGGSDQIKALVAELGGKWGPALKQVMGYMFTYMSIFTGPTGEMGGLTSLGLEGSGISVSSGMGGATAEMSLIRTIQRGEPLDKIISDAKAFTWDTGNEAALVKLANGERALVSGGPGGIAFQEGQITRLFGHTHPFFTSNVGASAADRAAIQALGQRSSWLVEGGTVTKFTFK